MRRRNYGKRSYGGYRRRRSGKSYRSYRVSRGGIRL